ncbi:hypothetical protein U370_03865 [Anaplasma marginale str. Dawn]|nr:hypothetical protein U128_04010 [Anaplasma marginale str. Gypsy Plains]AGZ80132.1 hypothetical protein U370_03865 [Anaplasma marginale str. Dawn]
MDNRRSACIQNGSDCSSIKAEIAAECAKDTARHITTEAETRRHLATA